MSCGNESNSGGIVDPIPDAAVNLTPTDELVLCFPEWHSRDLQRGINIFKQLYPNVNVVVEFVEWGANGHDTYTQQVNTELMAGAGADVVMADSIFFNDLYKTVDTGAFLNLSSVMDEDDDFYIENFYKPIFDAGLYKNGRYFVPLSFDLDLLTYIPSVLESIEFDLSKNSNMVSFFEELAACLPKLKENPSFEYAFSRFPFLEIAFNYAGISLVDYEYKIVIPDEAILQSFCEAYKPYWAIDYQKGRGAWGDAGGFDSQQLGRILFGWSYSTPYQLAHIRGISEILNTSVEMMMIPNVTGGVNALLQNALAISANSQNQLNAWNFIKVMLSDQIQTGSYHMGVFNGKLPVSRSAMQLTVDFIAARGVSITSGSGAVYSFQLTPEEHKQTLDIFDNITDCFIQNQAIYDFFLDSMIPYFQDEKSYDECVAELKTKLMFYVSE